jgi:hypothetical protein
VKSTRETRVLSVWTGFTAATVTVKAAGVMTDAMEINLYQVGEYFDSAGTELTYQIVKPTRNKIGYFHQVERNIKLQKLLTTWNSVSMADKVVARFPIALHTI